MASVAETIAHITDAPSWDERVARIRQIPQRHGILEHTPIFAQVARVLYVPHLAPDYAYVPVNDFYELPHFLKAYGKAAAATSEFTDVSVDRLAASIRAEPTVLLPLRVITGLTKGEFADSTRLVAEALGLKALSAGKVDSMERVGSTTSADQARVAAVSALFDAHHVQYIRTGSHNQAEIADRFEVTVQPAPDFVVYDEAGNLRAMLECKGANDGGTARDKALRFARLHDESVRLGGIPLIAVLGGLGWTRVNDTLGPVIRHCDGRVFSISNLPELLTVAPFPSLSQP